MNAFEFLRDKVRSRADRCGTYGTCVPDVSVLNWLDEAERNSDADDYVAWCRYTDKTIVTCDSDEEGAFRVYRRGDKDTMDKFNQMADCLDDIRKIIDATDYASRLNRQQAIRDRINFDIPDTPSNCSTGSKP